MRRRHDNLGDGQKETTRKEIEEEEREIQLQPRLKKEADEQRERGRRPQTQVSSRIRIHGCGVEFHIWRKYRMDGRFNRRGVGGKTSVRLKV
jgi:hypothetical protein